jgi:DedD protein
MSREADLYKDKIEVSLDGRQIFYLFFGGAVIVGLVFVLGVMVGRRVEARGHVDRARTTAAVDPLAALDRLEDKGGGMSFKASLMGTGVESNVEQQIGAIEKARAKPGEAKKVDDKKVDDKKTDDKKADEAKKTEEKKLDDAKPGEAKKLDEAKKLGEVKKVDEPKKLDEAKKVDAKAVAGEAKKPDDKKLGEVNKVDEAKKSEEPKKIDGKKPEVATDVKPEAAKASEPKPEAPKSKYTLQLSSFQDRAEADAFLSALKGQGYQAHVTEASVTGKTFYRVRMGSYRSIEAANDAKAEFEKASKKSASVMKL